MNILAEELNSVLDGTVAGRLFSKLGRRIYFPKGIIAQSGEAKKHAHVANATIGMAFKDGKPLILSAIAEGMPTLTPAEAVTYAPTAGVEAVRNAWKKEIIRKNPSINPDGFSLPAVVPGLSAGISYLADLFLDEGDTILTSDPSWDNYALIFGERRGAAVQEVPFFGDADGLNIAGIWDAVAKAAKTGTVRIILNFPNNPSGYAPTKKEADELTALIRETAEGGADVLVICDDAYFGLFYEEDTYKESLFGRFAALHERVLAVKIDGPTKEDYVWGLRVGFVTFGSAGMDGSSYDALVKKLMGIIRSSVSCANTPAQYLMLKTLEDSRTAGEKKTYYGYLEARYRKVKEFLAANPDHPILKPLPFNSGYFMSFRCTGIDAEELRQELLSKHGVGTIALGNKYLRVAFSSAEADQIEGIYRTIFETAAGMK
ncbi:aminotransferase class I/II-fold pyridoxal phosphate-dependent enzyme [Breznakiella homolactica]|uniref:Aminotransferase class I/II-fold pyridoxal phosphate-dependent enzyme n=1 Tax=Breznakiella homolactica TaxID=2798577 RepID=A0A7T7XM85_9SPIR|nr:aminotransferase class I/II-fold pyridoxal phosphate-dependent enzyme [Breznakiella homolactica]QQO08956.1 aminotransferase class I/II-fold pyridoxal phosphate-dependent enzyme [Breznakiella homolactica]